MTEAHHDPELCRQLALKVMKWRWHEEFRGTHDGGGLEWEEVWVRYWEDPENDARWDSHWDPCCIAGHSWMLEQKMKELDFGYIWNGEKAIFPGTPPRHRDWIEGANRLHATALAAYLAIGGTLVRGIVLSLIQMDETQEIPGALAADQVTK